MHIRDYTFFFYCKMPLTEVSQFLERKIITKDLADFLRDKFVQETLKNTFVEPIEDDRYIHVTSKSKSRFKASLAPNEVLSLEFHPSGNPLAVSRMDGSLTVWIFRHHRGIFERAQKVYLRDAAAFERVITSISWNPRELNQFATTSNSNEIPLWRIDDTKRDLAKLKVITVGSHRSKIIKCLYDPMGEWLLAITKNGAVYIFDPKNDYSLYHNSNLWEHLKYQDSIYSVCWNNTGTHIFVGLKNGSLVVLEWQPGREGNSTHCLKMITELKNHRNSITVLKMDPRGIYLVSGSSDGSCIVWDLEILCPKSVISDLSASVVGIDIDHLGQTLVICTSDSQLGFYDLKDGSLVAQRSRESLHSDLVFGFHPGKSWYITSGKNDTLENHTMSASDPLKYWKVEYEKQLNALRSVKAAEQTSELDSRSHNHGPSISSDSDVLPMGRGNLGFRGSQVNSSAGGRAKRYHPNKREREPIHLKKSDDIPRKSRFNK